ncbi:DUF3108 domain-containing protein [bacterium]|nr:MAG: DUF3108 domain-containing protein [bacterium]
MLQRNILIFALILFTAFFPAPEAFCSAPEEKAASFIGEEARYDVSWSGVAAGTAKLTVKSGESGQIRFNAIAKTNSGVGILYPLNVKYESNINPADFGSTLFTTSGKEGWGDEVERRVEFAGAESKYYKDGKLKKTLEIPPDVRDPLSMIYYFRLVTLPEEGRTFPFKIADGKSVVDGTLKVLGREKVKTPLGEFKTVKVEPQMKGIKGIFGKSPDAHMYIWFSDDDRRLMVKILSEVSVGSFTALLSGLQGATLPHQEPVSELPALKEEAR